MRAKSNKSASLKAYIHDYCNEIYVNSKMLHISTLQCVKPIVMRVHHVAEHQSALHDVLYFTYIVVTHSNRQTEAVEALQLWS